MQLGCCVYNGLIYSVTLADVSLIVNGVATPNNSLVDLEDVLYTTAAYEAPTNSRATQHDSTLLCVTDLVDCCETQGRGNWYFPDETMVPVDTGHGFRSNRGDYDVVNGRQFNGSVRLYLYYSSQIRGRFHCVLPNVDNVEQTLYAYIGKISVNILGTCQNIIICHYACCPL